MDNSTKKPLTYYQYITTQIISELSINSFGYHKSKDDASHVGPEKRSVNAIHYVLSGHGTYIVDGKRYELSAGDMFFLPTGNMIEYYSDNDDPYEYVWIAFIGAKARSLFELVGFDAEQPVYRPSSELIRTYMKELLSIDGTLISCELFVLSVLFRVLALLMEERKSLVPQKKRCQEEYVYNVTEYIKNNFSDKTLCLDKISREIKISPSHLSALFKAQTGQTINNYIISMRVAKACALLAKREKSVQAIASEVGFSDAHHFSKIFKKYIGETPSRYQASAKPEIT